MASGRGVAAGPGRPIWEAPQNGQYFAPAGTLAPQLGHRDPCTPVFHPRVYF